MGQRMGRIEICASGCPAIFIYHGRAVCGPNLYDTFTSSESADTSDKGQMNPIATDLSNGALKDYSAAEWKIVAGSSDL